MTREEAARKVLEYVYGEMPEDAAREFERLLALDGDLAAEVEGVRRVRAAAAALKPVEMPKEVRRRVMLHARRRLAMRRKDRVGVFEALERFFLSPSFSGGLALVLALGVGVHILMRGGMEDRLTRLEQGERAGAKQAPAAEVAPNPRSVSSVVPVIEGKPEAPPDLTATVTKKQAESRTPGKASQDAMDGLLGSKGVGHDVPARLLATPARPAARPEPLGLEGFGSGAGYFTGGGAGVGRASVAEKAPGPEKAAGGERERFAVPPPGDHRLEEMAGPSVRDGDEESVQIHPGVAGGPSPSVASQVPAAAAPAPPAPAGLKAEQKKGNILGLLDTDEPGKADKTTETESSSPKKSVEDEKVKDASPLAEARRLRAEGSLAASLAAYQKALAGNLPVGLLKQALAEAADIAERLGRTEAAASFRKRLAEIQAQVPAAAPADTLR